MSSLFYKRLGFGPPIILLHGFCETHQIWDGFAESLTADFSVVSFDLPGFGESQLISPLSIESVALRIIQELEALKMNRCVIVGHSLGGYVALAMQQARPELFAGIVLFHSTVFADTEEKKSNRNKTIEFVKNYGVAPFVDTFVTNLFHQKNHPSVLEIHKMAMQTPLETLINYSEAMRDRPARDQIEGFDLLILAGRFDAIIPISVSEQMSTLSDRTTLKVLPSSGHMGMLEDREKSLDSIRAFGLTRLV
ncbi:MAG: alpha/beta hydrolase [Cyclobacteriaceae bacterium]|nr:alpha/beta hydrolase [Cyclobacteriaceae bacterium]